MQNVKKVRIMDLTLSPDDKYGFEVLIATMSEIQMQDIKGLSFTPYNFGGNKEIFMYDPSSPEAKMLIQDPEMIKELNMDTYSEGTIDLGHGRQKSYYHTSYLDMLFKKGAVQMPPPEGWEDVDWDD